MRPTADRVTCEAAVAPKDYRGKPHDETCERSAFSAGDDWHLPLVPLVSVE